MIAPRGTVLVYHDHQLTALRDDLLRDAQVLDLRTGALTQAAPPLPGKDRTLKNAAAERQGRLL